MKNFLKNKIPDTLIEYLVLISGELKFQLILTGQTVYALRPAADYLYSQVLLVRLLVLPEY